MSLSTVDKRVQRRARQRSTIRFQCVTVPQPAFAQSEKGESHDFRQFFA